MWWLRGSRESEPLKASGHRSLIELKTLRFQETTMPTPHKRSKPRASSASRIERVCAEAAAEAPSPEAAQVLAAHTTEQRLLLAGLLATLTHWFGPVEHWLGGIDDPRQQLKVTYPLHSLLWVGVLMFLC